MEDKPTIIIEGGGFKTAFTTGIIDLFVTYDYNPFERYYGISGGSVALSYLLSGQYNACFSGLLHLAKDKQFVNMNRMLSNQGYMNIDYLRTIATEISPLDIEAATKFTKNKEVYIVATKIKNGKAVYLEPNKKNWIDSLIASSTLPFVTKGKHKVDGNNYMDGGWSDPLPVKKAYKTGSKNILVIRTSPADTRHSQSWPDYFGSFYHRDNKGLANCFEKSHEKYNESIDFMLNPPSDCVIKQIAPRRLLKSTTYTYSISTLKKDYRYGLELGLNFLAKQKKSKK